MASFQPRLRFQYPVGAFKSWYPGHMTAFMKSIVPRLIDADMVIECRDARLPLSSINPQFEDLIDNAWGKEWRSRKDGDVGRPRKRLVVYTKRDLAEEKYEEPLRAAFQKHANQHILFADTRDPKDMKRVMRQATDFAKQHREHLLNMKVLIVGMPNIGKSSLINSLRYAGLKKGGHFITSSLPGQTKTSGSTLKIFDDPPIYAVDAPGVMEPWFGDDDIAMERTLKFDATGGIQGSLYSNEISADYLLYKLNLRMAESEVAPMGHPDRIVPFTYGLPYSSTVHVPTNSIQHFLEKLASRIGALARGGIPDTTRAAAFFLQHFRDGKLGRYTLDDLEQKDDIYRDPEFRFGEDAVYNAGARGAQDGTLEHQETLQFIEDEEAQRPTLGRLEAPVASPDSLLPSPTAPTDPASIISPPSRPSPSAEEIYARNHLRLLLPPSTTSHASPTFTPSAPPWARPSSSSHPLTRYAPPIQIPHSLTEKVSEAVRRYYLGRWYKEEEGRVSRSQERQMERVARRQGKRKLAQSIRVSRQRRVGLAQSPLPRVPRLKAPLEVGIIKRLE